MQGEIVINKIAIEENLIDMLTKVIFTYKFKHCLDLVSILDW